MRGIWLVLAWLFAVLLLVTAALPLLLPVLPTVAALQASWDTLTSLSWGVVAAAGALAFLFGVAYSRVGGAGAALSRAAWLLAAVQWLWALGNLPAGLPQFGVGVGMAALGAWWGRPTAGRARPKQMRRKQMRPKQMKVVEPEAAVASATAGAALDDSETSLPEQLRFSVPSQSVQREGTQSAASSLQMAQGQDWAGQVWWDESEVSEQRRDTTSD